MIDDATVERLGRHWENGWNGPDLDVIMAPFAEGVVFSSPFVPRITGDPEDDTIAGKAAVREGCIAVTTRGVDARAGRGPSRSSAPGQGQLVGRGGPGQPG